MSTVFQGSPSESERIGAETLILKKALRGAVYDLRVGIPGVIRSFNPDTQLCTVEVTINDKLFINNQWIDKKIPILEDALLQLPGDLTWAITFPQLVGVECYVHFADMCINAWWSTGQVPSNQEVDRRHDMSDCICVPAVRSLLKAIQNYSTTQLQIRSLDGAIVIGLDESSANITAPVINLDGALHLSGVPTATAPAYPTFALPIKINNVQYYMQLKTTP